MLSGCPFCHHSQSSPYRERQQLRSGGFGNILLCHECGILYPQVRMDQNETEHYLPQSDWEYDADLLSLDDPCVEFTDNNFVVKMLKDVEKTGKSLDIGTWNGMYTYIFQALGFDSYGLEPQIAAAEFARSKGLKVIQGHFPETIPQELLRYKYHLIAMLEMIYYLHDVKKSLLSVRELLQENGVLLIKTHQGYSKYYEYDNSYFRRYGDYVQGIPTLTSLQYCLTWAGFKVIKLAGLTEESVKKKLNCTTVTMENADRLYLLAEKA